MDRLVTSMAFCEAPVDFAYGGAPARTCAKLAADAGAGGSVPSSRPAEKEAAAAETRDGSATASSARGRQAECALALDGLNCFETVVMRIGPS